MVSIALLNSNKLHRSSLGLKGFTVIELLIVIIVIGILVAIAAVSFTGVTNQVKATATDVDIANVKKAMDMYMAKNNTLPTTDQTMLNELKFLKVVKLGSIYDGISVTKGEYLVRHVNGNYYTVYYWNYAEERWEKHSYSYFNGGVTDDGATWGGINDPDDYSSPCKTHNLNECNPPPQ